MKRTPKTGLWNSLYEVAVLGLALAALVGGKRDGELIGIATFWDSYLRK